MVEAASRARESVGATTVTYLPDGQARLSPEKFFPASAGGWATHAEFLDELGRFPVSIGSFLIRSADRTILVDLGIGRVDFELPGLAHFTGGGLLDALAAEGVAPQDVDTVVFTHLHHDHVGWTTDVAPGPDTPAGVQAAGLTFPNARYLVAEPEWRHWQGTEELVGPHPTAVQQWLAPRLEFFTDGEEIAPGVRILATAGHTPGHSSVVVSDPTGADPGRIIVLGDVMHCQVQVSESHWAFVFDVDPEQGVRTRQQLLKELESPDTVVAGGHFAGQVFGRVLPPEYRRAWHSGTTPAPQRP